MTGDAGDVRARARWVEDRYGTTTPEVFMAVALKVKPGDDVEQPRRNNHEALVGRRVILALGQPDDLIRVQVRELWERRYRVNVYVGADAVSARVANSYFLETDGDGNITKSTPKIKRQYGPVAEGPATPVPSAACV